MKDHSVFNARQIKAIEIMAAGGDVGDVARALKVNQNTVHVWKKRVGFVDAVITRAREMIREHLPEMYQAAIRQAASGSHKYFKTLIEHLDRLEEMKSHTSDSSITFTWKNPVVNDND